jgi:hypothetical protein
VGIGLGKSVNASNMPECGKWSQSVGGDSAAASAAGQVSRGFSRNGASLCAIHRKVSVKISLGPLTKCLNRLSGLH